MDVIFRTSFSELVQFCASALLSGGIVSDVFRLFFLDLARTKTRQAKRIARVRVSLLTSVGCAEWNTHLGATTYYPDHTLTAAHEKYCGGIFTVT